MVKQTSFEVFLLTIFLKKKKKKINFWHKAVPVSKVRVREQFADQILWMNSLI